MVKETKRKCSHMMKENQNADIYYEMFIAQYNNYVGLPVHKRELYA